MYTVYAKDRVLLFDILKSIYALLVDCILAPFPDIVVSYGTAFSRIDVTIFFMITGHFYSEAVKMEGTIKQNWTARQIKEIFIFMLEVNLVCFVWKWFRTVVTSDMYF